MGWLYMYETDLFLCRYLMSRLKSGEFRTATQKIERKYSVKYIYSQPIYRHHIKAGR